MDLVNLVIGQIVLPWTHHQFLVFMKMVQDVMEPHALLDVSQDISPLEIDERNVVGVENLVGTGRVNQDNVKLVTQLSQVQMIQT